MKEVLVDENAYYTANFGKENEATQEGCCKMIHFAASPLLSIVDYKM